MEEAVAMIGGNLPLAINESAAPVAHQRKGFQSYRAIMAGLSKPMFPVIAMAIILVAVSGKLISSSGVVQTIAVYVVQAGLTGKLFAAATFLLTCLLAFSTGTSVGTYFVVIPILYPVGVMAGVDPVFMIGAIVSGAAFGDNLALISDTTIASAGTQNADLDNVVKTRLKYSIPAAAIALICFLLFTETGPTGVRMEGTAEAAANSLSLVMLLGVFCFLAPWTVHCVIPAQQTAAFGERLAVAPASIPFVNFYAIAMLVILVVMVITGYGRKSKISD